MHPAVRSLILIANTVICFGICIAAIGGLVAFFAHPALVAFLAINVLLVIVGHFTSGGIAKGVKEDRKNRWVLGIFGSLMILAAALPPTFDRLNYLTIGGETTRWIADGIYLVGGFLRIWPVFVLGKRFSGLVALQKDHQLVTVGIYSKIRHPSYLGLIVMSLGWGLVFRSVIGLIVGAAIIWPLVARMNAEEAFLGEAFGEEYGAYRRRTWRLIPGVY